MYRLSLGISQPPLTVRWYQKITKHELIVEINSSRKHRIEKSDIFCLCSTTEASHLSNGNVIIIIIIIIITRFQTIWRYCSS
jgi:hypothetical protein